MKKLSILTIFLQLFLTTVFAQNVPLGMKYQAVARNKAGEILANEKIDLKINLMSGNLRKPVIYYSENHSIVTNDLGLFTLVIGEGKSTDAGFDKIPWSSDEIWMEVGIKDKTQSDFVTISNSKLLAVPYAFHAASAAKLDPVLLSHPYEWTATCSCHGPLSQVKLLYLGASGVIIKAYNDENMNPNKLITTFTNVQNGDILIVNGPSPNGKLHNEITMEILGTPEIVTEIPTSCDQQFVGENFGNFSVLSHKDDDNAECTVCNVRMDWKVGGNALFDICNWLGTKSHTDLVMITNNIERLRIDKDGNINLNRSLHIGANLDVDSNVNLNKIGGATVNNGPLTVARLSPTLLSGTLTVDKATQLNTSLTVNGITDLNSNLNVNFLSPTKLTGTLQVNGVTDLNNSLNVNNLSPTVLTGTLRGDKDVTFGSHVLLSDASLQSYTTTNGALVVNGGLGLGGNLNVGGASKFGGATQFGGAVSITDNTQSTDTLTGALKVTGGVAIGKRLNVREGTLLFNTLGVSGPTTLSNTLYVAGITNIGNSTQSTSTSTGALVINGGLGLGGNLNVTGTEGIAGAVTIGGITTINNAFNVNAGTGHVDIFSSANGGISTDLNAYPLVVRGAGNGMIIKVNTSLANHLNKFISFVDNTGGLRGRIEGETEAELDDEQLYKSTKLELELQLGIAAANIVKDGFTIVGASTASTLCVGLGACVTAPPVGPIVAAVAIAVVDAAKLVLAEELLRNYKSDRRARLGVTYASSAADYAEWLPKLNKAEEFRAGDIVGLKGGFISKSTIGADKIMVISTNPLVLGNAPANGMEQDFKKVAFMGQVPVKVLGKVDLGDYIIASGANDGTGKAKKPTELTTADYPAIVGIAWSASSEYMSYVNVAVGINNGDISKLLEKQESKVTSLTNEVNDLKIQMNKNNELLAKLIPGYRATTYAVSAPGVQDIEVVHTQDLRQPLTAKEQSTSNGRIYYNLSRSEIEEGINIAEQTMKADGVEPSKNLFFVRMKKDASYKEEIIKTISDAFTKNMNLLKQSEKKVLN